MKYNLEPQVVTLRFRDEEVVLELPSALSRVATGRKIYE
jgi:hypothetical protein